jgi:hypothetical protein
LTTDEKATPPGRPAAPLPSAAELVARAQAFLSREGAGSLGSPKGPGFPEFDLTAWPADGGDRWAVMDLLLRHVEANLQFAQQRLAGRGAIPEGMKRRFFFLRFGWVERAVLKFQGLLVRDTHEAIAGIVEAQRGLVRALRRHLEDERPGGSQ